MIRVNSVYPTTVDTDMAQNDPMYALSRSIRGLMSKDR
jgi:hypothetical protein